MLTGLPDRHVDQTYLIKTHPTGTKIAKVDTGLQDVGSGFMVIDGKRYAEPTKAMLQCQVTLLCCLLERKNM
jgi:hypothetical protein